MAYKRRDGIYHVYHLWDETDKMNYGGSHTSYKGIDPKNDTYMGSSTKVDAAIAKGNVFIKTIISTHDTKEEMIEAEQKYLKENDAVNSSDWYNQVIAFPDFDGYWYYNPETKEEIYVVEGTQPDNYVTGRPSISRLRWYYNSETMKQIYVVKGTQPDNYVAGRLTYKRMVKGDK